MLRGHHPTLFLFAALLSCSNAEDDGAAWFDITSNAAPNCTGVLSMEVNCSIFRFTESNCEDPELSCDIFQFQILNEDDCNGSSASNCILFRNNVSECGSPSENCELFVILESEANCDESSGCNLFTFREANCTESSCEIPVFQQSDSKGNVSNCDRFGFEEYGCLNTESLRCQLFKFDEFEIFECNSSSCSLFSFEEKQELPNCFSVDGTCMNFKFEEFGCNISSTSTCDLITFGEKQEGPNCSRAGGACTDFKFEEFGCNGSLCEPFRFREETMNCTFAVLCGEFMFEDVICQSQRMSCDTMQFEDFLCSAPSGGCEIFTFKEVKCNHSEPLGLGCGNISFNESECARTMPCQTTFHFEEFECSVTSSCGAFQFEEFNCSSGDSCSFVGFKDSDCRGNSSQFCSVFHFQEHICENGSSCDLFRFGESMCEVGRSGGCNMFGFEETECNNSKDSNCSTFSFEDLSCDSTKSPCSTFEEYLCTNNSFCELFSFEEIVCQNINTTCGEFSFQEIECNQRAIQSSQACWQFMFEEVICNGSTACSMFTFAERNCSNAMSCNKFLHEEVVCNSSLGCSGIHFEEMNCSAPNFCFNFQFVERNCSNVGSRNCAAFGWEEDACHETSSTTRCNNFLFEEMEVGCSESISSSDSISSCNTFIWEELLVTACNDSNCNVFQFREINCSNATFSCPFTWKEIECKQRLSPESNCSVFQFQETNCTESGWLCSTFKEIDFNNSATDGCNLIDFEETICPDKKSCAAFVFDEFSCSEFAFFDGTTCACMENFFEIVEGSIARCIPCWNGSTSHAGSSVAPSCLCRIGYTRGASRCEPCALGTYKNETGSATCISCPAGSTTSTLGSYSASDCVCLPGYSGSILSCDQCPFGKYSTGGAEPCLPCNVCDSNAISSGTCLPGTGPIDTVQCACKPGFFGDGISCVKIVLPEVLSFGPSSVFCQVAGQSVKVQVRNFPAFSTSGISGSIQLGKDVFSLETLAVSVMGNFSSSSGTVQLIVPNSIPNSNFGMALVTISVALGPTSESVFFYLEFKPYVSGPPAISYFTPQSLYIGSNLTLFVGLIQIRPIMNASEIKVTSSGAVSPLLIAVAYSNLQSTMLSIGFGRVDIIGDFKISLTTTDSDGMEHTMRPITISVWPIPAPVVLAHTLYPRSRTGGSVSESGRVIQVLIQYLDPSAVATSINVTMETQSNKQIILDVVSLALTNSFCLEILCALHTLVFLLPAGGNPDGHDVSTVASLIVFENGNKVRSDNLTFRYISQLEPLLISNSPISQSVTSAGRELITTYIQNFPSAQCAKSSCSLDIVKIKVTFGSQIGTIVSRFDTGGLIAIQMLSPPVNTGGSVIVQIQAYTNRSSSAVSVSFPFRYTIPPAVVTPIDGTVFGGTVITITANGWGNVSENIKNPSDVIVACSGQEATIDQILVGSSNATYSIVSVVARTPRSPQNAPVTMQCSMSPSLALGGPATVNSVFDWIYYRPPVILKFSPPTATVGGFTGSASGNSMVITIADLPQIMGITDVVVTIQATGAGTGSLSKVANVQSFVISLGQTLLTVTVPPSDAITDTQATVGVLLVRGGFETRSASSTSFRYYVPKPSIQAVRWCQECNPGPSCIQNGRCGNLQQPLINRIPVRVVGNLIVTVQNLNTFNLSIRSNSNSSLIRLQVGDLSNKALLRVSSVSSAFGAYFTAGLEFFLGNISQLQCVEMQLKFISSNTSLKLGGLTCFDQSLNLQCLTASGLNLSACAGPSDQSTRFSFVARITGPFSLMKGEFPKVTFGNIGASSVQVSSSIETTYIDLLIIPPAYGTLQSSVSVPFVIASLNGTSTVSSYWTFWNAPAPQSSTFDTLGISITVFFDQTTNRGGVSAPNQNCSALFHKATVMQFGSDPATAVCSWITSQQLTIVLGNGASIVPNDVLRFIGGRIQSSNLLSPFLKDTMIQVGLPTIVNAPVINIVGPSVVDPCSPLMVYATGISPRDLTYRWSCTNDAGLDRALRNLPPSPTLSLAAGTPEMVTLDKTYIISAFAVDFFGTPSTPVTLSVLKQSSPCPTFVFTPSFALIFRTIPILIVGVAQFSNCPIPRDALLYKWRQTAGPTLSSQARRLLETASSPSIYFPSQSFQAGTIYVFTVRLQLGSDASKFSEASFTLQVGLQTIVARIAGGDNVARSNTSEFTLDATPSKDLDRSDVTNAQSNLTYEWTCTILDGDMYIPCTDVDGNPLVLTSGPKLTVPSRLLAVTIDEPYVFTVGVQDFRRLKQKNFDSVNVYIVYVPTLSIGIEIFSQSFLRGTTEIINGDRRLILDAACPSDSHGPNSNILSYKWSISPPTSNSRRSAFPQGFDGEVFIVNGGLGALIPGVRYIFSVQCQETVVLASNLMIPRIGSTSYALTVNDPPAGGSCSVCLVGGSGCVKTGRPAVDAFRVSCVNWADQDTPLQYRFGFNLRKDNTVWGSFGKVSFYDYRLPSGTIEIHAEIQDSFGASSGLILVDTISVTRSSSRRMLLANGIDWTAAIGALTELVNTQNSKDLNALLLTDAIELWTEVQDADLDLNSGRNLTDRFITMASQSLYFAAKTSDNVCDSYSIIDEISKAALLSSMSIRAAISSIGYGLSDISYMDSINQACISSALNALGSAALALKKSKDKNISDDFFLYGIGNSAISTLTYLYLARATVSDDPLIIHTNISSHSFMKRDQLIFGQSLELLLSASIIFASPQKVTFSMPAILVNQILSNLNLSMSNFNVYLSGTGYVPSSEQHIIRSPLVSLVLYTPASSIPLIVSNVPQPINISIPIELESDDAFDSFKNQAVCLYWDTANSNYSSYGVKVLAVTKTRVLCQSNHLSDFVVAQDLSISPSAGSVAFSVVAGSTAIPTMTNSTSADFVVTGVSFPRSSTAHTDVAGSVIMTSSTGAGFVVTGANISSTSTGNTIISEGATMVSSTAADFIVPGGGISASSTANTIISGSTRSNTAHFAVTNANWMTSETPTFPVTNWSAGGSPMFSETGAVFSASALSQSGTAVSTTQTNLTVISGNMTTVMGSSTPASGDVTVAEMEVSSLISTTFGTTITSITSGITGLQVLVGTTTMSTVTKTTSSIDLTGGGILPDTINNATIADAVKNSTLAQALAQGPFLPVTVSLDQAQIMFASIIEFAGGSGKKCTAAVPFLVLPGVILQTIIGYIYPVGFAVAVKTSKLDIRNVNFDRRKSAVTTFTDVFNYSSTDMKILISGYPLSESSRRKNGNVGRRTSSCDPGTEWRYLKDGMPLNYSCNCPANSLCSGQTLCNVTPVASESWMVVVVNKSLCSTMSTEPTVIAMVTTPSPSNDGAQLKIGLGLGLGLGLFLVLFAGFGYVFFKIPQEQIQKIGQEPEEPLPSPAPVPSTGIEAQPPSSAKKLVFSSNLASEATLVPLATASMVFSVAQEPVTPEPISSALNPPDFNALGQFQPFADENDPYKDLSDFRSTSNYVVGI